MRRITLFTAALVAAAVAAPAAQSLPTSERVVLSVGHTDAVSPLWENGQLRLSVKDDTGEEAVRRDPAEVLFHARPEAQMAIPEGMPPEYAFLGKPGDVIWMLPQIQNDDLLWPGWSSETIQDGVFEDDALHWTLNDVVGPGAVKLHVDGTFSVAAVPFDSEDGLPDTTSMATRTHAHFNWTFTAPGLYKLTFEVAGTPLGGAPVTTGPVEYRFFVGDLADLPPDHPVTELSITGAKAQYAPGETVSLSASQSPPTELDHYHWFTRCGANDWSEVGGMATHTFVAEPAHDGCLYKVVLYDGGHEEVASAPAIAIHVQPPTGDDVPAPTQPGPPTMPEPSPAPGPADPSAVSPVKGTLKLSSARLDGRVLRLGLRLGARGRLSVHVRRDGKVVARAKTRRVGAGQRAVAFRLPRTLGPGGYRVRVTARSGGKTLVRTVALKVR